MEYVLFGTLAVVLVCLLVFLFRKRRKPSDIPKAVLDLIDQAEVPDVPTDTHGVEQYMKVYDSRGTFGGMVGSLQPEGFTFLDSFRNVVRVPYDEVGVEGDVVRLKKTFDELGDGREFSQRKEGAIN
jgi:hypothetical protein